MSNIRFFGERKSILPYLLGLLLLALIIGGIYIYAKNKDTTTNNATSNTSSSLSSSMMSRSESNSMMPSFNSMNSMMPSNMMSSSMMNMMNQTTVDAVANATVPTNLNNQTITIISAKVASVNDDKTFKLSSSNNKNVYAVLSSSLNGGANQNKFQITTGQIVSLSGTILPMPTSDILQSSWKLNDADLKDALTYPVYILVTDIK